MYCVLPMAGLGDSATFMNSFDPPRPSTANAANTQSVDEEEVGRGRRGT